MGDTVGHDKLCCIENHQFADYICRMCNVRRDDLDNPKFKYKLRDTRILKSMFEKNDIAGIREMGYYACYENILMDLQYLDKRGLNMALPPESMHVICIGYMAHLVQGFSRVRKLRSGAKTEEDSDRGIHYVFGEAYRMKEQVEGKLRKIGRLLQRQPDPGRPTTAFDSYIIDPDPKNKNKTKTGKKQAHEMRGVLLTLLYFMVLSGNSDDLATMMGEKNCQSM